MNFVTFATTNGYDSFYGNICSLLDELEISSKLTSLGVKSDDVGELAIKASKDAATQTNPRKATVSELEALISEALDNAR